MSREFKGADGKTYQVAETPHERWPGQMAPGCVWVGHVSGGHRGSRAKLAPSEESRPDAMIAGLVEDAEANHGNMPASETVEWYETWDPEAGEWVRLPVPHPVLQSSEHGTGTDVGAGAQGSGEPDRGGPPCGTGEGG